MKTGVSTLPCASSRVPARAAPSVAWIANFIGLASQSRLLLPWGEHRGGGRSEQTFLLGFLTFGFRLLDHRNDAYLRELVPLLAPRRFVERRHVLELAGIADDHTGPFNQPAQFVSRLRPLDACFPPCWADTWICSLSTHPMPPKCFMRPSDVADNRGNIVVPMIKPSRSLYVCAIPTSFRLDQGGIPVASRGQANMPPPLIPLRPGVGNGFPVSGRTAVFL